MSFRFLARLRTSPSSATGAACESCNKREVHCNRGERVRQLLRPRQRLPGDSPHLIADRDIVSLDERRTDRGLVRVTSNPNDLEPIPDCTFLSELRLDDLGNVERRSVDDRVVLQAPVGEELGPPRNASAALADERRRRGQIEPADQVRDQQLPARLDGDERALIAELVDVEFGLGRPNLLFPDVGLYLIDVDRVAGRIVHVVPEECLTVPTAGGDQQHDGVDVGADQARRGADRA